MAEEILPNLYRIEIPLPNNPLKALNSYVIKAPERFLIIDTGMNRRECADAMASGLTELAVDLDKTEFFITHLHADHAGLVGSLASSTSIIYFNEIDASLLNKGLGEEEWQKTERLYHAHGFPTTELEGAMAMHPGRRYSSQKRLDYHIVKEGDSLSVGDYSFTCIETPGHTPGHMCLYEPRRKILICGDHILFDITPNITFWPDFKNALKVYLSSLEKVLALDVDLVLPGHRSTWGNLRKRVAELREHHQARLDEVLTALKNGEKTAYQVAPYVTWNIDCSSWDTFPLQQKWFAVGETVAHIEYLEENKTVKRRIENGRIVFSVI